MAKLLYSDFDKAAHIKHLSGKFSVLKLNERRRKSREGNKICLLEKKNAYSNEKKKCGENQNST